MAHQGKNRAPRLGGKHAEEPWFRKRRVNNRIRDRIAKQSRRANRRKK